MGKRKRKGTAKTQVVAVVSEHTFHVLAYAVRDGKELAVCLDCAHTEQWEKAK